MRSSLGRDGANNPGWTELGALDRKLGEMQRDIEVLQRRVAELVQERRDRAHDEYQGQRLLGNLLVLAGRRLRDE